MWWGQVCLGTLPQPARVVALRNAHLLRELIGLNEDTGQAWMPKLIRLLLSMQAAVADAQAAGKTTLPPKQLAGYEAAYTRFIQEGLRVNPPPKPTGKRGRPKPTLRKQGYSILDGLTSIVAGSPLMPRPEP
jgi:hypothetical protein